MSDDTFALYLEALLAGLDFDAVNARWLVLDGKAQDHSSKGQSIPPWLDAEREQLRPIVAELHSRRVESLVALRQRNPHRYEGLTYALQRLAALDLGSFDYELVRICRAWHASGFTGAALELAQRLAVADGAANDRVGRAQLLAELGDEAGAEQARKEGAATAQRRGDWRVFVDPKTEREAAKAKRARERAAKEQAAAGGQQQRKAA